MKNKLSGKELFDFLTKISKDVVLYPSGHIELKHKKNDSYYFWLPDGTPFFIKNNAPTKLHIWLSGHFMAMLDSEDFFTFYEPNGKIIEKKIEDIEFIKSENCFYCLSIDGTISKFTI